MIHSFDTKAKKNLFRKQSIEEDLEGEEEFYYNEIEVPLNGEFITLCSAAAVGSGLCVSATLATPPAVFSTSAPPSSAAMLLPSTLADHMDMARPPHENPEYNFAHSRNFAALRPSPAHSQPPRRNPAHLASYPPPPPPPPQPSAFSSITAAVPIAIPVTNLAFARSAVSSPIKIHQNTSKIHFLISATCAQQQSSSTGAPSSQRRQIHSSKSKTKSKCFKCC